MKIITKQIETWKIDDADLPKEVKSNILQKHSDINTDYDWWENVYDDAKEIGLKLTGFDLGRSQEITCQYNGNFTTLADEIIKTHGETTKTYEFAKQFLVLYDKLIETASKDENGDFQRVGELDGSLDTLEKMFLKQILGEYWKMLEEEYNYRMSEEEIIETLKENEYNFDRFGDIVNG